MEIGIRALRWTTVALTLALATTTLAADYPVAADRLRMLNRSNGSRWFYFRALKEPNITTATIADPTASGATLEVFGSGAGDGNSGVITLPPENWRQLTNSRGYNYRDRAAVHGISQIWIQRGAQGGALIITGRGPAWTYEVTQPQTDVTVRLIIGSSVYCARFTDFQPNRAGIVVAKKNPIIPDCN